MSQQTPENTGDNYSPAYLKLLPGGELANRAERAYAHLRDCDLCARYCRINRLETAKGAVCRTAEEAVVHSSCAHHGEEDPLCGECGSGAIFFSWCNLRCNYCQNWEISQKGAGDPASSEQIADMMLDLQSQGCHNINFVSPSHVVAQIIRAVLIAAEQGLHLPLVYNTGGYDSLEALRLLDGIIDIYMPDMKYGSSQITRSLSRIRNYVDVNRAAVREMHRQVGDLVLDENGVALRGLLVRHLVLPAGLAGTDQVLEFIAHEISPNTYLNLMEQYYPSYQVSNQSPLDQRLDVRTYLTALSQASRYGLNRLDVRRAGLY